MIRKITYIAFILCLINLAWADDYEGDCGTPDTIQDLTTTITAIDTAKVIQIFPMFPEDTLQYGSDSLPTALVEYGDTSGYGPGQIFYRSSFGKLILNIDVNPGFNNKHILLPHTRNWYYTNYDTIYNTHNYPEYMTAVNMDWAAKIDSLIDFAQYDGDSDGYVDYLAVDFDSVYMPRYDTLHSGWGGIAKICFDTTYSLYYTTNDTNSHGQTILIDGQHNGHIQNTIDTGRPWYDYSAGTWAHEICHHIGNLNSYMHDWEQHVAHGYQFHASAFSSQFRSPVTHKRRRSYFSPYWALKAGWLSEDDINVLYQPIYQDTLADYITAKDLIKVPVASNEYFLISNHQNLLYNENHWPSKGLFIYHLENDVSIQDTILHKKEDLEIADGLFVLNTDSTDIIAAPDSGYDEIDFRWKYASDTTLLRITGANYGDSGDAFVPPMSIVFDHTTNPNSNLYSYHNSKWYQDIPSHFSIRNLEEDPSDSTVLVMDLLANHWYDSLTANTTWGDSTKETGYAITGDFIIPAACTLTVRKGTTIYFQADEDDKAGGANGSRCELIVYGTLIAEGDSANRIAFMPSSEQLGTAAVQDWYGIRFLPHSRGDLDFCDIEYCYYGIHMRDSSLVSVDNCAFKNSYYAGIRNDSSSLYVSKCTFEDNNYGIISDHAKSEVVASVFINNKIYGVTVQFEPAYSLGASSIIDNTIRTGQNSILAGSYYGIRVYSIDDVVVEGNNVRTYGLSGIYLYNTDASVENNEVVNCLYYGIYSTSSCDGLITHCDFDSLSYGIYLASGSINTVNYCDFNTANAGIRIFGNQ